MSSLTFKHIYKVYPNGVKAVNDFNLEIKDREFVVFVGPSGCGKSTSLRMIAGLEEISAGELYIDDQIINYVEPKNRDIAMVFQNYALYPHLNVYENIAFGLKLRKTPKEVIKEKVNKAAEMLGLTEYLKTKPGALSGGQRQRVALGRALVREPKVFLLDEPLSNLDAKLRVSMRNEITKLHEKLQTTFIYVTHDQVEAMTMGDRIVVMKDGYIQQVDSPKNLYRYPINKFVAGFIGSPQLTFVEAYLLKEKDTIKLSIKDTDVSFVIPEDYLLNVDPKFFDGNTLVTFGIRSEFVSIDKDKFEFKAKARIASIEELGTEVQLFVNFDVNKDVFVVANDDSETIHTDVTLKADADYKGKIGNIIDISLDLKNLYLFDGESEEIINPRVPNHARIQARVNKNKLEMFGLSFPLTNMFDDLNGEYEVTIPTNAIKEDENGQKMKVYDAKEVEDAYLITFKEKDGYFSILSEKAYKKGDVVNVSFDIKSFDFYKDNQLVKGHLNIENELVGTAYYHKVKGENGKKEKVLDYLIDDKTFSCYNVAAHRTFITNNDRTLYDIDLSFKFDAYHIHLDDDGPVEVSPIQILEYSNEKFLLCEYNGNKLLVYIDKENIDFADKLKVRIDIDDIHVFDKEKNIRLV